MDVIVRITEISYSQFLQDIDRRIQQSFASHALIATPAAQTKDELLSTRQAARLLDVSKVTLSNWRARGLIRSSKIGRHILFKRSELLEDLQNIPTKRKDSTYE